MKSRMAKNIAKISINLSINLQFPYVAYFNERGVI